MKIAYGRSKKGDVSEAVRTITEPAALFFSVAKEDMLERAASEIEKTFPGVASIGGVGQAYIDRQFFDAGITVIAMKENIKVVADVLEEASVMPIKYIRRLENAVRAVGGERGNTACFDICSAARMCAPLQHCPIICAVLAMILRAVQAIRRWLPATAGYTRMHAPFSSSGISEER